MILLHTGDWHIGQTFYEYDRKDEHCKFLSWLKMKIHELHADILLIAGDIFDNPNPSAESQKIFYRFLKEVTSENSSLQIILIAGNHDSAARLEAPNPLLNEMHVFVKGVIKRKQNGDIDLADLVIPLKEGEKIAAWCIAVPYLRQGDSISSGRNGEGVAGLYRAVYSDFEKKMGKGKSIVMMGHLHVNGAEISEDDRSERTVVGGLESTRPDIFYSGNILYTALGHLHKAQRISGRENIWYAGSPLPMSFSEKNYKHGINLVEIDENRLKRVERIPFDPPVAVISLPREPRPLNEVIREIEKLPDGPVDGNSPYLEIKVLITEPEPSMRYYIEEALQNKSVRLARLAAFSLAGFSEKRMVTYEELKTLQPLSMAEDVFSDRYGSEMPDELKTLLQQVIREVEL